MLLDSRQVEAWLKRNADYLESEPQKSQYFWDESHNEKRRRKWLIRVYRELAENIIRNELEISRIKVEPKP